MADKFDQHPTKHDDHIEEPGTGAETDTQNESQDPEDDPDGPAIRRQVEFYFSDENLPNDEYFLGLTGGKENLPVSLNRISGFRKMRPFKPVSRIRAALERSTFLVLPDAKTVKRRYPLTIESKAKPRRDFDNIHVQTQLAARPWLTKAMLAPTGFEDSFADAPVTPQDAEAERDCYHPSLPFADRIETAIQRYRARRKLHQTNAAIFSAFLIYGGIQSSQRQFTGGLSKEDLASYTAAEIASMTAIDFVPEHIRQSDSSTSAFGSASSSSRWTIDFSRVASGFLSVGRLYELKVSGPEDARAVTSVLENFYRYLLHHDVCPEYSADIQRARKICSLADAEIVSAARVAENWPDAFNTACSVVFNGAYAGIYSAGESWDGAENLGWSRDQARKVVMTFIAAVGDERDHMGARAVFGANDGHADNETLEKVGPDCSRQVVLQIIDCTDLDKPALEVYAQAAVEGPFLQPPVRVRCRFLNQDYTVKRVAGADEVETGHEERDNQEDAEEETDGEEVVTLHLDLKQLSLTDPSLLAGLKFECTLCTTSRIPGLTWIDSVRSVQPSYFELLPNEEYDARKTRFFSATGEAGRAADGIPVEYMKRLRGIYERGWKDREELNGVEETTD